MKGPWLSLAAVIALLGMLTAVSCEKENHSPVISGVTGSTSIAAGSTGAYTCTASDSDNDSLAYTWSATEGVLSSTSGATVNWTAPDHSGTAILSVTVRDGRGGSDSQDLTVTVVPATRTWVRWDGAIQAGYYKYWSDWIDAGSTIAGSFSVDAHDITFLLLDEGNYNSWSGGGGYTALVEYSRSAGNTFTVLAPVDGIYYVVLDNTYSLFTDKFCHLTATVTSP